MKTILSLVSFLTIQSLALADNPVPAGTAAAAPQAPGMGAMLFPFALMFGVMYFLMIRPQQKRMKDHQSLLQNLKEGDEVLTASGILGTVKGISEKVVTLEIDKDVRVKVIKGQIAQVMKGDETAKLASAGQ